MAGALEGLEGLFDPPPAPPEQPDPGTVAFMLPIDGLHNFFENSPPEAEYRAYVYLTPMNESAVGWITRWWRRVYDYFYVPWVGPIVPWYAGRATTPW